MTPATRTCSCGRPLSAQPMMLVADHQVHLQVRDPRLRVQHRRPMSRPGISPVPASPAPYFAARRLPGRTFRYNWPPPRSFQAHLQSHVPPTPLRPSLHGTGAASSARPAPSRTGLRPRRIPRSSRWASNPSRVPQYYRLSGWIPAFSRSIKSATAKSPASLVGDMRLNTFSIRL